MPSLPHLIGTKALAGWVSNYATVWEEELQKDLKPIKDYHSMKCLILGTPNLTQSKILPPDIQGFYSAVLLLVVVLYYVLYEFLAFQIMVILGLYWLFI